MPAATAAAREGTKRRIDDRYRLLKLSAALGRAGKVREGKAQAAWHAGLGETQLAILWAPSSIHRSIHPFGGRGHERARKDLMIMNIG